MGLMPYASLIPHSIYLHVPFCRHRCGYCNFTLVSGRDDLVERYIDCVEREIQQRLADFEEPPLIETIFVGGGTPTHLSQSQLQRILSAVTDAFPIASDVEYSVEANPLDINESKLKTLKDLGVNRISLGVQSFRDEKLKFLERDHSGDKAKHVVKLCQDTLEKVSIDLIFGAQGETVAQWESDLEEAVKLGPDHVSTYGLTIEKGTQFWNRQNRGTLMEVPEDDSATMYELAIDFLSGAQNSSQQDFEHYEISSFSKGDSRCRHNEIYWKCQPYFAFGAGAARFLFGKRETNHRSTATYIKRVEAGQSPTHESESIDALTYARENLIFGLRRICGIDKLEFQSKTGIPLQELAGQSIENLVSGGFLKWDGNQLSLTRQGILLCDSVLLQLI